MLTNKKILDACCGSRMFWFDKQNENVLFMDNRVLHDILCDGRKLDIEPDIIGDFRNIPFEDDSFYLIVFDPPHLLKVGENSWLAKKYGKLSENWAMDIKQGFKECMRVLKPNGTLIFKWNEQQIKLSEILKVIEYKPLFGNKRADTHWLVFFKEEEVVMSDLISRSALMHELEKETFSAEVYNKDFDGVTISNLLTLGDVDKVVDEIPTVEARHTGYWRESNGIFYCSECNNGYKNQPTLMGQPMFDYCPACGAKMRKNGATKSNDGVKGGGENERN